LSDCRNGFVTPEHARGHKAQNNFVGTQDTLISDQQLSASNQRLAAPRALTLDAQAKYDQIEASRQGVDRRRRDPRGAAIADHRQSALAICRCAQASAELQGELEPRHPALRQIEPQVEYLRRTIGEETTASAGGEERSHARPRLRSPR